MEQTAQQRRVTYSSQRGTYNLDPSRLFDVVDDLSTYMRFEDGKHRTRNPEYLKPATSFRGHGRRLVLSTEVADQPRFLTSFDLAELVLSEDGKRLTLEVYEHPNVAIDPSYLTFVAKQYSLE